MKNNLKVLRFLLFLLSNKALVSFFRNRILSTRKYNEDNGILEVMSFVRRWIKYGDAVFYAAFIFRNSKEGQEYWAELCEKWMKTN